MRKLISITMLLLFFGLLVFSLKCGFQQTFTLLTEEQQQDSTKIQLDRMERKLNLIIPDFKKAGYKYDFTKEEYEVVE